MKRAANPKAGPDRLPPSDRLDPLKGGRSVTKFPVAWYSPTVSNLSSIVAKLNMICPSGHAESRTRTRSSRVVSNVNRRRPIYAAAHPHPGRFYAGCSTFLPVFDCRVDTFEALHNRSPFAVDAICMVGARVRDGGGQLILNPLGLFTIFPQERPAKHTTDVWRQSRTYHVLLSSPLWPAWKRSRP